MLALRVRVALFAILCTGCSPMTLRELVDRRLGNDQGFQATVKAVNAAEQAYHCVADTPIDELETHQTQRKVADLIAQGRDSYRRALTYKINQGYSTLDTSWIWVYDAPKGLSRVPLSGGSTLVVNLLSDGVYVLQVESSRGKEVVLFETGMKVSVAPDFRPFMMGDEVAFQDLLVLMGRKHRRVEPAVTPPR